MRAGGGCDRGWPKMSDAKWSSMKATRGCIRLSKGNRFVGLYVGPLYVGVILSVWWLWYPRDAWMHWGRAGSSIIRIGSVVFVWWGR